MAGASSRLFRWLFRQGLCLPAFGAHGLSCHVAYRVFMLRKKRLRRHRYERPGCLRVHAWRVRLLLAQSWPSGRRASGARGVVIVAAETASALGAALASLLAETVRRRSCSSGGPLGSCAEHGRMSYASSHRQPRLFSRANGGRAPTLAINTACEVDCRQKTAHFRRSLCLGAVGGQALCRRRVPRRGLALLVHRLAVADKRPRGQEAKTCYFRLACFRVASVCLAVWPSGCLAVWLSAPRFAHQRCRIVERPLTTNTSPAPRRQTERKQKTEDACRCACARAQCRTGLVQNAANRPKQQ